MLIIITMIINEIIGMKIMMMIRRIIYNYDLTTEKVSFEILKDWEVLRDFWLRRNLCTWCIVGYSIVWEQQLWMLKIHTLCVDINHNRQQMKSTPMVINKLSGCVSKQNFGALSLMIIYHVWKWFIFQNSCPLNPKVKFLIALVTRLNIYVGLHTK